jgi:stage III sporulation protein SpoIIIAA
MNSGEIYTITDNLDALLAVLPKPLQQAITPEMRGGLLEIVLDLGRRPEVRFPDRFEYLGDDEVTREDLDHVEARLGTFGDDNRAGIPATLHRISAMRNRRGVVVGLTLRVGRAVTGIVDILRDLIESGESLLLMGRPGLGKTTLLREMARVLADELNKRVVIVDTSNEIAGDGDVPHPAIGRARRMQVPRVSLQHDVMIEAVENHMPEVVVIDEIGHVEEALAARTIAERGVQLIATVHGNTLENLLANPTLSDLVGGITSVTLSDLEARRRGTQKTVLERKAPPSFGVVVEMESRDQMAVRRPVAEVVDSILRGFGAPAEQRCRDASGQIQIQTCLPNMEESAPPPFDRDKSTSKKSSRHKSQPEIIPFRGSLDPARARKIFASGVNRSRLMRAIKHLGLSMQIVPRWQDADTVLMLTEGGKIPRGSQLREAREAGLPMIAVNNNTYAEVVAVLSETFPSPSNLPPREAALEEAHNAAQRVLADAESSELRPQNKQIRQLQHQLAERYHLRSFSVGKEPHRRVRFLPMLPR